MFALRKCKSLEAFVNKVSLFLEDNMNKLKYFTMGFLIKIYIILGSYRGTLNLSLGNFNLYRLPMAVKKGTKKKQKSLEDFYI